jgi:pyrimidine operon attenuation protein/uracil phosphoribosyltransferase
MTNLLLDAEALYGELRSAVPRLMSAPRPTPAEGRIETVLVGVWSGGAWLAERLAADLQLGRAVGVISSTMHRDDFGERGLSGAEAKTRLPFEIDGAHVLLVDDVLYTGRTIRAVLNELFDYGRPASVELAVLVDRGGRELPIQAAYAAARVALPAAQRLSLARADDGRFTFAIEEAH